MFLVFISCLSSGALFLFLFFKWQEVKISRPIVRGKVFNLLEQKLSTFEESSTSTLYVLQKRVKRFLRLGVLFCKLLILWTVDFLWKFFGNLAKRLKAREKIIKLRNKIDKHLPPV